MLEYLLKASSFFFFKQKTAYEMAQCDWSSDVCSSDLDDGHVLEPAVVAAPGHGRGPTRRMVPGHELHRLVSEPQLRDADARTGHALETPEPVRVHDGVRHPAKLEDGGVERDRAVHVGHRERDRAHGSHGRGARRPGDGRWAAELLCL